MSFAMLVAIGLLVASCVVAGTILLLMPSSSPQRSRQEDTGPVGDEPSRPDSDDAPVTFADFPPEDSPQRSDHSPQQTPAPFDAMPEPSGGGCGLLVIVLFGLALLGTLVILASLLVSALM